MMAKLPAWMAVLFFSLAWAFGFFGQDMLKLMNVGFMWLAVGYATKD